MATQIFVNMPVKDLKRSVKFFTKLGYTFDPEFTNKDGTCMIVGKNMFVMLVVKKFFKSFTKKRICDATKCTEAIVTLSMQSRAKVDKMVAKAVAAGATTPRKSKDYGFMYQHGFQDLDGHLWDFIYMRPDES
ncbi:MAG: glyoxalase/bleomycin resistance/extradiol dioxygenase family protein [Candidatus Krumholzibacteriaceae bacterium]|jgi:predicted lactoylglutathione lyase